jgi:hypothetical protein
MRILGVVSLAVIAFVLGLVIEDTFGVTEALTSPSTSTSSTTTPESYDLVWAVTSDTWTVDTSRTSGPPFVMENGARCRRDGEDIVQVVVRNGQGEIIGTGRSLSTEGHVVGLDRAFTPARDLARYHEQVDTAQAQGAICLTPIRVPLTRIADIYEIESEVGRDSQVLSHDALFQDRIIVKSGEESSFDP